MSNYWCFIKHTGHENEAVILPFLEHYFVNFKFSLFAVHLMMLTATKII
jgi:hypothetical protein